MSKYTHTVEVIDPKKAAQYLKNLHPGQGRRDSKSTIESYAREMTGGTWDSDVAQPIVFDKNNSLVNGYHRLNAVIKANKKIQFLVVRGVDPKSFANYDAGYSRPMWMRRSIGRDRQAILGAIVRVALYPHSSLKQRVDQMDLTENMFKDELDYFEEHATGTHRPRTSSAAVKAGVVLAMRQFPDRKDKIVQSFNKLLCTDFTDDNDKSIVALYRRLVEERQDQMSSTLLAWHAFNPNKSRNKKLRIADARADIDFIKDNILGDLVGAIS